MNIENYNQLKDKIGEFVIISEATNIWLVETKELYNNNFYHIINSDAELLTKEQLNDLIEIDKKEVQAKKEIIENFNNKENIYLKVL